ncbi:MAG: hypothetical protein ACU0BC_00610 [Pseudooceanicola nanhaiensis]
MTAQSPARRVWQDFHWAFFLNTQGLILSLRRFALFLDREDTAAARCELETATEIMNASAASMHLAGSFGRDVYEDDIRPSMTPPNVQSDGFSGLMSWEHGVLVDLWRTLRPRFDSLPKALAPAHEAFVRAYRNMADGHTKVCSKFVGEDARSLRYEDRNAIVTLERFKANREALIDPGAGDRRRTGP